MSTSDAALANGHNGASGGPASGMEGGQWSEDNRKVLGWVADLLNGNSRETALMELSKKREQVPELALIIWHSFGMFTMFAEDTFGAICQRGRNWTRSTTRRTS